MVYRTMPAANKSTHEQLERYLKKLFALGSLNLLPFHTFLVCLEIKVITRLQGDMLRRCNGVRANTLAPIKETRSVPQ